MIRFEKEKLIIEIDTADYGTKVVYCRLVDALLEIIWYSLLTDDENIIRTETGWLALHLLPALLMKGESIDSRLQPATSQPKPH